MPQGQGSKPWIFLFVCGAAGAEALVLVRLGDGGS